MGHRRQHHHHVTENTILGSASYGIALFADDTAILSNNTIRGNHIDTVGEIGIYLYREPGATLKKNRIVGNSVRGAQAIGISLDEGTERNRVDSNLVVNRGVYGIVVAGNENKITGNHQ